MIVELRCALKAPPVIARRRSRRSDPAARRRSLDCLAFRLAM